MVVGQGSWAAGAVAELVLWRWRSRMGRAEAMAAVAAAARLNRCIVLRSCVRCVWRDARGQLHALQIALSHRVLQQQRLT